MPKTLLAPAFFVIVALAGCAAPPSAPPSAPQTAPPAAPQAALKRIEGTRWISAERSAGGLGVSYTFLHGGRVVEVLGAITEFSYSVEGDQLVMAVGGSELRARYTLDGSRLTLRGQDGIERVHQRAGPSDTPPVLHGLWAFRHDSGAPADLFFGARSRGVMRVLMRQRDGRYRLADEGTFQMQFEDGSARALTMSVEGEAMEIRGGPKVLHLRPALAP